MMTDTLGLVEAAQQYAEAGWAVLPLHTAVDGQCDCRTPGGCASPAKHPRTANGLTGASTDPETIARWWSMWPESNIGLVVPPNRLVVDIDKGGADAIKSAGRSLPRTAVARTGHGHHYIFETTEPVRPAVGILPHVDLRGPGSYIVAPPSVHVTGTPYRWARDDLSNVAPVPGWVVDLARERASGTGTATVGPGEPIPEGQRNATLASLAGAMRRKGSSESVILAALAAENAERCQPPLSEFELRSIAASVGRYAPVLEPPTPLRLIHGNEPTTELVTLADVEPTKVEWLWPGYVPLGKVTLLDGDPGLGKSTMTLDLAARGSRGDKSPSGDPLEQFSTLILTNEDDPGDTIRPRLDVAGGDPRYVHVMPSLTLPDQDDRLEALIVQTSARLVILDPLVEHLSDRVKTNSDHDVRRALAPLAVLAARYGVAVLCIRHLNKRTGDNAIYRGGGSIGFTGLARSVLAVGADPEDDGRAILAVIKSNLARRPRSLAYRLDAEGPYDPARVVWEGETDYTAETLIGRDLDTEAGKAGNLGKRLRDLIAANGGEMLVKDVYRALEADDFELTDANKALLFRARKRAGIEVEKVDMRGGWKWTLAA
jgi:hypothetical protein